MKIKCEVIRDLFPSYIDGLTSRESNQLIEEHLGECRECREYLDEMKDKNISFTEMLYDLTKEEIKAAKEHAKNVKKEKN